MHPIYRYEITVPKEAEDQNGHVNNIEYLRWMQDAAMQHSEKTGCTQATAAAGATWVVRTHKIEYLKPAFAFDRVTVLTWVCNFRRVLSLRKYRIMRPADNTLLAEGETDWVFVDALKGTMRSIPKEVKGTFELLPEDREMEVVTAQQQPSSGGKADDLLLDYQQVSEELQKAKRDQDQIRNDLENAIERSNVMAMKAEIANVELSQIINTSMDGMYLVYQDFTVKRINATLLSFLNISESEAVGKKCYELMPSESCRTPKCSLTKLLHGKPHIEVDIEHVRKDGVQVPFIFAATPFRGIDGTVIGMVARFKDITDRKYAENTLKEANERLERLSTSDGLTQVANRRSFDQTLEREWNRLRRTNEPLSLIMSDVDFFKLYNDTYGHQGGDDCLKSVAKALSETVQRSGDCVARYGGEEFAVILPATDEKGALRVAEKIRQTVENMGMEHTKSSVAPCVTLSLGVAAIIPSENETPEYLIKCADKALYAAKSSGRNRVSVGEQKEAPAAQAELHLE